MADALDAAQLISEWIQKYSSDEMAEDRMIESAFLLQFERIGEALRVARDKRAILENDFPTIHEWIGFRHRLVHDYREIDLELIWYSAETEIPQLIHTLESLIKP